MNIVFFDIKNFDDILNLKQNQVSEGLTLDYKRDFPDLNDDNSKLSLLKDICAFANTHGGQIIYGIDEEKGVPKELKGIELNDPDELKLRLSNIIKTGFEPRLGGISIESISYNGINNKYFFIIKVSASWNAPHWIEFKNHHKFYGRASVNNYELSIVEIRDKINMLNACKDKILKFREERVNLIYKQETPIALKYGPQLIFHLIPLSAFATNDEISMQDLKYVYDNPEGKKLFKSFQDISHHSGVEINLEGLLTFQEQYSEEQRAYSHFYRNGIVEAVVTLPIESTGILNNPSSLSVRKYEAYLIQQEYMGLLNKLDFGLPIYIFISFINIEGLVLEFIYKEGGNTYRKPSLPFKKNIILFPEVIANSFDEPVDTLLKPVFDRISNAVGLIKCPHYNENEQYTSF